MVAALGGDGVQRSGGVATREGGGCLGGLSGPGGDRLVAVELEQVVGGGDQPPLGATRRSSSALEAVDAPVELRVCEHGLDHPLAFSVEPAPVIGLQHAAHERIGAACWRPITGAGSTENAKG